VGVGPREDRSYYLDPGVSEPVPVLGLLEEVVAEFVEMVAKPARIPDADASA